MAQTKEGVKKFKATMLETYGSEKAWRKHMSDNAKLSQESWDENGRKPRGFAANRDRARAAGAKGGRISRRVKAKTE